MEDILHYIAVFSIAIAVYSGVRMMWYVQERKIGRRSLFSWNPFWIVDYKEMTKSETGKIGIWAKINIGSFIIGFIAISILTFLSKI
jgi:hypothetical protein